LSFSHHGALPSVLVVVVVLVLGHPARLRVVTEEGLFLIMCQFVVKKTIATLEGLLLTFSAAAATAATASGFRR
jgi:hypothetical protein